MTVDSFGLALPAEWVQIPLGADHFEPFVRRQRERLTALGDLTATDARRLELVLRQVRNDCLRERVRLVAVLATTDGAGALLAATCTLATLSQPALGTTLPLTVNTLAAALAGRARDADEGAVTDLEPPERTALPCGPAVRLVRLHTTPSDAPDEALPLFAVHHLVPYDDGRRAVALTCATPAVELARPLSELFDEVANSLRLFRDSDPTDPVT